MEAHGVVDYVSGDVLVGGEVCSVEGVSEESCGGVVYADDVCLFEWVSGESDLLEWSGLLVEDFEGYVVFVFWFEEGYFVVLVDDVYGAVCEEAAYFCALAGCEEVFGFYVEEHGGDDVVSVCDCVYEVVYCGVCAE